MIKEKDALEVENMFGNDLKKLDQFCQIQNLWKKTCNCKKLNLERKQSSHWIL